VSRGNVNSNRRSNVYRKDTLKWGRVINRRPDS
jgi:hypothetical protein